MLKNIIERTLYAECSGDIESMPYVASVIYNRAKGDVDKMASVITREKQFSCWNKMSTSEFRPDTFKVRDINFKYDSAGKQTGTNPDASAKLAQKIADQMIHGKFHPLLGMSYTHYHATNMPSPPKWADGIKGVKKGKHKFYKSPDFK